MSASEPVAVVRTFGGGGTSDLQRILTDADQLTGRLHRLALAVGLSQEYLAEAFDHLAADDGPNSPSHRRRAEHARKIATACYQLDGQLQDS